MTKSLPFFLSPLALMVLTGCMSGPPQLMLHPQGRNVTYAKMFDQAFCGKSSDGSYQVVLVADDSPTAGKSKKSPADAPIKPATQQPLRQIVCVKVLWRPLSGTRSSYVANAAIDWYIFSNTADGGEDMLLYQGSGYVTLNPKDDTTKVNIRASDLRPAFVHGNLRDTIGETRVAGDFVAANNTPRTMDLVNATRQRIATVASSQ